MEETEPLYRTPAQRLQLVIEYARECDPAALAARLGVAPGPVEAVMAGRRALGRRLAGRIAAEWHIFHPEWLVSGKGVSPFETAKAVTAQISPSLELRCIPFFDTLSPDASGADALPRHFLYLPVQLSAGAEVATLCYDPALLPVIARGSCLLMCPCQTGAITPDAIYMVTTSDFCLVRYLTATADPDLLCLNGLHPETEGSVAVDRRDIRSLYRVCGVLTSFAAEG